MEQLKHTKSLMNQSMAITIISVVIFLLSLIVQFWFGTILSFILAIVGFWLFLGFEKKYYEIKHSPEAWEEPTTVYAFYFHLNTEHPYYKKSDKFVMVQEHIPGDNFLPNYASDWEKEWKPYILPPDQDWFILYKIGKRLPSDFLKMNPHLDLHHVEKREEGTIVA